jgi:hypothetical protein
MSEPLRRPNRSRSTRELRCTRGNGPRRCGGAATCTRHRGARRASTAPPRASCFLAPTPGRVGASHTRPTRQAGERRSLLTVPTPGAGTGATSWRPWHSSAQRMGYPPAHPVATFTPLPAHRRVGRAPLRAWRAGPRVALQPATVGSSASTGYRAEDLDRHRNHPRRPRVGVGQR